MNFKTKLFKEQNMIKIIYLLVDVYFPFYRN